ncbi:MAG: hypothetical protein K6F94_00860 [Bacteroidaceae bacterium]|nr:hypothetical protein [Bacteroidaceae bacterium]
MKKTYIIPRTETVMLDCQGICEVLTVSATGTGDGTQLSKGEFEGEGGSDWDDEW